MYLVLFSICFLFPAHVPTPPPNIPLLRLRNCARNGTSPPSPSPSPPCFASSIRCCGPGGSTVAEQQHLFCFFEPSFFSTFVSLNKIFFFVLRTCACSLVLANFFFLLLPTDRRPTIYIILLRRPIDEKPRSHLKELSR